VESLLREGAATLWAAFGDEDWCRVKDIGVRSWLGQEYWRLRGEGVEVSRAQGYRILQDALRNYARWVDQADGIEVRLSENELGSLG